MCDYSLENYSSRKAEKDDHLVVYSFGSGTRGFAPDDLRPIPVCLLPGTQLSFPDGCPIENRTFFGWPRKPTLYKEATFRQKDIGKVGVHHDGVEFPDGKFVFLQNLPSGVKATVLQLPITEKPLHVEALEAPSAGEMISRSLAQVS